MDQMALKMFNCPACGPVETCFIHGDWVDKANYADMVFEITRPSFEAFDAQVSERSVVKPDSLAQPRILAEVEDFAAGTRKFQCSTCGKVFSIPQRVQDPSAVSGGPAVLGSTQGQTPNMPWNMPPIPMGWNAGPAPGFGASGPNRNAIWAMFDTKFTEAELDTILDDIGSGAANFSSKADKIDEVVDRLY